ncbi:MAG TPA: hypothetical protein VJU61_09600 [Polyangiaceae bacterium]|nr:hypothetical protein [Polyangiaceae bacterium]
MNIAALLLACSVHADDALLLSIAYVYGRGNPYAVVDASFNAVDRDDAVGVDDSAASSPSAARAALARILAIGGDPVLGLLPVRPEWASEFGKTLDDIFEPCGNISIASAKLSEFDHACRNRGSPQGVQRRGCTLDLYGRHLGLPALRRAVLADLTLTNPFPGDSAAASALPSGVAAPAGADLFFPTAPLTPAAALLPPGG